MRMADDPSGCGSFTIAADHPCLQGHFPADPIVPGVVLLDHALALLAVARAGLSMGALSRVRFHQAVRPDQPVLVQSRKGSDGTLRFTGSHAGRTVFSGTVHGTAAAAP